MIDKDNQHSFVKTYVIAVIICIGFLAFSLLFIFHIMRLNQQESANYLNESAQQSQTSVEKQIDPGVSIYSKDEFYKKPDCIVVLGGDGTLLSVARASCIYDMPLFGINLGKLGFLTEGEASNYEHLLEALCDGEFFLEKRMMLSSSIHRPNGKCETFLALNDVLVKNTGFRMMDIKAYAGKEGENMIDFFRADGMIIASPTGSTAYSLAAGGPVVAPGTDVMIVNPICPHRLHDRAYVIAAEEDITIRFDERERDIIVSFDGQNIIPIGARDEVIVKKAPYTAN